MNSSEPLGNLWVDIFVYIILNSSLKFANFSFC